MPCHACYVMSCPTSFYSFHYIMMHSLHVQSPFHSTACVLTSSAQVPSHFGAHAVVRTQSHAMACNGMA
jgi:hypothetical protein